MRRYPLMNTHLRRRPRELGSIRYRFSVCLVVLALLAVPTVPAFATQLSWSKGCSTSYTVVSHGRGSNWQNHVRSIYSQYFSYSGHQDRDAWWGVSSGSGYVDSVLTSNVYGWCSYIG